MKPYTVKTRIKEPPYFEVRLAKVLHRNRTGGGGADAAPSGFLNAAPKRLKRLNLVTFPNRVLGKF